MTTTDATQTTQTTDTQDAQTQIKELIAQRDAAKQRARAAEDAIKAREISEAKAEAKAKEDAERALLTSKGQYEEILKQQEAKHAKSIAAFQSKMLPTKITAIASKIDGIAPTALDDIPSLLRDRIIVDPDTFELSVLGDDGKPLTDERLRPVEPAAFIEAFVRARPHMMIDKMAAGTGARPGTGAASPGHPVYTCEAAMADDAVNKAWKAADPDGHKKAFHEWSSPEKVMARAKAKPRQV